MTKYLKTRLNIIRRVIVFIVRCSSLTARMNNNWRVSIVISTIFIAILEIYKSRILLILIKSEESIYNEIFLENQDAQNLVRIAKDIEDISPTQMQTLNSKWGKELNAKIIKDVFLQVLNVNIGISQVEIIKKYGSITYLLKSIVLFWERFNINIKIGDVIPLFIASVELSKYNEIVEDHSVETMIRVLENSFKDKRLGHRVMQSYETKLVISIFGRFISKVNVNKKLQSDVYFSDKIVGIQNLIREWDEYRTA